MPNQAGTLLQGSGVGILFRGWRQAIEEFLGYFFLKYLSGSNIEQAAAGIGRLGDFAVIWAGDLNPQPQLKTLTVERGWGSNKS